MAEHRIITKGDTAGRNRIEEGITAKEIIEPDTWTPIIALRITPLNQDKITIKATVSASIKSPYGYGSLRLAWTQGDLTHSITESEGRILPLGSGEYSRDFSIAGLTMGDAMGITLEGQPFGETLTIDNAYLTAEEW